MSQEFYAVDLPGKSLYDKEFSVSIRKITPIEQKYILSLSQKEQKSSRDYINFIKKLISIDNQEVQFEDLFWFDVQYLLYFIRFTTYSKYPIKLIFKCNNYNEELEEFCTNQIKKEITRQDLKIYTPEDLPDLVTTIELENLGKTKIRNKTMRDDINIENFIKKQRLDSEDSYMRLLLLDLSLISTDHSLEELYDLAEKGEITASDIIGIESWFTENIWGVKEEVTIKCDKCGKEETRDYSLSLEDFFSAV